MSDPKIDHDDSSPTETLAGGGRELLDRLAEEFTERCRLGESPTVAEYEARHPEHAGAIRNFLATVALMEQLKGPSYPGGGEKVVRAPERFGEFHVVRELGRGGMGVVYEAVQESLGRHVALKAIHHLHLDARRLQRFQREAQAVARLHHANIVPIFGAGEHEGLPYYVMQYIQGSGLDALLASWRKDGSTRPEERWRFVAGVGVQAAEALQYAHDQGILHRDIKPANLLVDENQVVWVTDFGLAKLTGHDDLTASGDVIGTLRYLAPEALRGETDGRSDVYSLGLTLYELLTLTPPFGELTPSQLLRHVSEGQPVRPRKLDARIPRDLETIVLKATAREPDHRYPDARALADDLNCFLEDRPIRARRVTPFERAWRWGRRNKAIAATTATAVMSLIVAAVVGWVGYAVTSVKRSEAERATRRAEQNVALSLDVFGELFDKLAPDDSLLDPPPGRGRRPPRPPGRPEDGSPPPGSPGRRSRPPGPDEGPFGEPPSPPSADQQPGGPRRPPPEPGGNPFEPDRGGPNGRARRGGPENDTELLRSVLTFYDRFARQNATNPRLQGEAAWAYRRVGALYQRLGQGAEAEKSNARAVEIFEDLTAQFPRDPAYRSKLVDTYIMADPWSADPVSLGLLEQRLKRARVVIDQLAAEAPENLDYAQAQIHVHAKLGAVLHRKERFDDAESSYLQAIALGGKLCERSPRPLRARIDRAMIRESLAELQLERGRRDEARSTLDADAEELLSLTPRESSSPMIADRFERLAEFFEQAGDTDRALELARRAREASWHDPNGVDQSGDRRPRTHRPRPETP